MISLIMPIYNEEKNKLLIPALESIANQTYKDLEFVIVDGDSSDKTPEILLKFGLDHMNLKFACIQSEKHIGCHASIGVGMKSVSGDYIAPFCGSDDINHQERFEKQVKFLEEHPEISAVGSWFEYIDEEQNSLGYVKTSITSEELRRTAYDFGFAPTTLLVRKELLDKFPIPPTSCGDIEWKLQVLSNGYKITNLPEYLVKVCKRMSGMTGEGRQKLAKETLPVLLKYSPRFLDWHTVWRILRCIAISILPSKTSFGLAYKGGEK